MSNTGENAELNGRDIWECANQLLGYVDQNTEERLAQFLIREGNAATDLAGEVARLRAALAAADARIAELEGLVKRLQWQCDRRDERIAATHQRAETAETLLEEAWRALAPFIRLADNVFSDGKNATVADEVTLWCFNDTDITFGDLRRARACKSNAEGKEPTLLEEARRALEWALADMNGETKYDNPLQRIACEDRARATLDRIGK